MYYTFHCKSYHCEVILYSYVLLLLLTMTCSESTLVRPCVLIGSGTVEMLLYHALHPQVWFLWYGYPVRKYCFYVILWRRHSRISSCICIYIYTVGTLYNTVNFCWNTHKRHSIARPKGRGMGCLLWVQRATYCVDLSKLSSIKYLL